MQKAAESPEERTARLAAKKAAAAKARLAAESPEERTARLAKKAAAAKAKRAENQFNCG